MGAEIDLVAVLEDLRARRDKLDTMIGNLEDFLGLDSVSATSAPRIQRVSGPREIEADAFLKMTIPDAARKYLEMVRSPQTMAQIWEALKRGGLPHAQYNAVYVAIWRRETPKGIFFRVDEDESLWGLAEWYPSNPNVRKKTKPAKSKPAKKPSAKATRMKATKAPKGQSTPNGGVTLVVGCEKILREAGQPVHISELISKLKDKFGKITNSSNLSGTLRKDAKFKNLGKNTWALSEWPTELISKSWPA